MNNSIDFDWERFLPNQDFLKQYYQGDECYEKKFHALFVSILNLAEPHNKFILQESDLFTITEMASGSLVLKFIQSISNRDN